MYFPWKNIAVISLDCVNTKVFPVRPYVKGFRFYNFLCYLLTN